MADYITDLDVSTSPAEEKNLIEHGYKKIDVNLDLGTKRCGDPIFLWYKQGGFSAITKLQLTYNDPMAKGLKAAGYTKIDKDLNAGTDGDHIYLWHRKGSEEYDTPIVDISVSTDYNEDATKFAAGWEELACDLNRNDEDAPPIHILVKRLQQTYVFDVTATDSFASDKTLFQEGYIRLDEDTNRGAGGKSVFLWYRQTIDPSMALTDLQVSLTDSERQQYQQQGYDFVSVNLNGGTGSDNKVFLWYKKQERGNPITGILLLQKSAAPAYKKAGVTVIEKNLNAGKNCRPEYICFNQKG